MNNPKSQCVTKKSKVESAAEDGKKVCFCLCNKRSLIIASIYNALPSRSCDYRRAVIVLCIVSLIFSIIGIVNPALGQAFQAEEYPELEQIVKDHQTNLLIMAIVHIVMTVLALVGAILFNFYMVSRKGQFVSVQS
jgi:hypothetical protein